MIRRTSLAVLVAIIAGCTSSRTGLSGKPDLSLRVGGINVSTIARRLEKKDIESLVQVLRKERIDVLAVQGITRYPGVRTRVDLVTELSERADMNQVFGEMVNNAGRQTGNAVFSKYPIRSSENQSFSDHKSVEFEAALHALIDGGVGEIHVVSVTFPVNANSQEQILCMKALASASVKASPAVLCGNMPALSGREGEAGLEDTSPVVRGSKENPAKIWYAAGGVLKPLEVHASGTELGTLSIVEFGLFRKQ